MVLVDENVPEAALIEHAQIGLALQDLHGDGDQIVEIQSVGPGEFGLVGAVDLDRAPRDGRMGRLGEFVGRLELPLGTRDAAQEGFGGHRAFAVSRARGGHGAFDRAELVVAVVDREGGRKASIPRQLTAEHTGADAVEGSDPVGKAYLRHQHPSPLPHLPGGLVGEGHGEDTPRGDTVGGGEVRDTVREDASLPRAGARQHEHGSAFDGDGLALARVKAL